MGAAAVSTVLKREAITLSLVDVATAAGRLLASGVLSAAMTVELTEADATWHDRCSVDG
jgi:hypothetical protein